MTDKRSVTLLDTVEAISDGKPVDWNSAMSNHPEISPLLKSLRDIESLMHAFNTVTEEVQTAPAPVHAPEEYVAQWGHLRKLRFIGEGGFGKVYRAFDPMLEQDVALKLWNKSVNGMELDITEMLSEARKLAKVHHRNVLVVHGADRHDERAGMWTDFIEGETLEARLEKVGKFSAHDAIGVGRDLCRALAAIHKAGLVHRDVKTLNVMRTSEGKIVLMDFGSVGELSKSGMLRTSTNRGTPLTMPPEQLQGEAIGPTADIYSLGVLLYHLVTAEYPIEARSIEELAYMHASGTAVPLLDRRPDLPADFVRVVEQAMATDPSERYPSAGAMEKALDAALANPARDSKPPPHWWTHVRAAWKWLVAKPARWAAATGVLVVVAAGVYVIGDQIRDPNSVQPRPPGNDAQTVDPTPGGDVTPSEELPPQTNANPDPPVQPAPAPVQPVAFAAEASLYRETPNGDELLLPGAHVKTGDALWLEVEGNLKMYVYVFNREQAGPGLVMFPRSEYDTKNPFKPSTKHRLPGGVNSNFPYWRLDDAGGTDAIIVVASETRQEGLERLISSVRPPLLRGGERPAPRIEELDPILEDLPGNPEILRIDLENPMP